MGVSSCRETAVKFNDYFEFPREFDMAPYTAATLAKTEGGELSSTALLASEKAYVLHNLMGGVHTNITPPPLLTTPSRRGHVQWKFGQWGQTQQYSWRRARSWCEHQVPTQGDCGPQRTGQWGTLLLFHSSQVGLILRFVNNCLWGDP